MIVTCACGAKLKVNDEKITASGVKIKCPKCGNPHLVKKPEPAAVASKAGEISMPWFASSTPSPANKPLVLIAHDSKVVADMIDQVVSEAGYDTTHAPDGLEALRKATALKPQAMIVDVGLTGIYGFELCERLKGDPDTRDIKIILLSSVYGLTAYKRSPVTLYGADDYIEKHHIPDKLVSKIKRLLSGEQPGIPAPPAVSRPVSAVQGRKESEQPGHGSSPLLQSNGMMVGVSPTDGITAAERLPNVPEASTAGEREEKPVVPAFLGVSPKVPVTLNNGRTRPAVPVKPEAIAQPPRPAEVIPQAAHFPTAAKTEPARAKTISPDAVLQDESVVLDGSYFEHEEYDAPAATVKKPAADPEEIEKARRFARLIVSDIALYNQDIVAEGLRKGTFFELLEEDITEGRILYDKRVPEAIRSSGDYYQEAFDDFIATKKKQR